MRHPQLDTILGELRAALRALYGERLARLVLYGSQARGDAAPLSDIDVLVVLEGPVLAGEEIDRTGDATADLSLKHTTVVSCTFVSEEQYEQRRSPFFLNVRKEGVAL